MLHRTFCTVGLRLPFLAVRGDPVSGIGFPRKPHSSTRKAFALVDGNAPISMYHAQKCTHLVTRLDVVSVSLSPVLHPPRRADRGSPKVLIKLCKILDNTMFSTTSWKQYVHTSCNNRPVTRPAACMRFPSPPDKEVLVATLLGTRHALANDDRADCP